MDVNEKNLPYITGTEAIAAFRDKSLSPVELMQAVIKRAEDANGALNCITHEFFDRALVQARDAEQAYQSSAADPRPLEGLPTAIKDYHPVAGELTTYGSTVFRDYRPTTTAPTVERLLDAGAIMHIRTTTPEQGHTGVTHSKLWGVTRNPWNTDFSPGGSSGGSAAAVAAGLTTLADGTDGGGSVRIPASASGIFGYKPPFGRNPTDRDHPSEGLLAYGPMTRSVADAALMQNVMSGQHPADLHSLRDRVELPTTFPTVRGMRIALSMDLGYFDVSDEVRERTYAAARVFESLGCIVEEVALGWTNSARDAWLTQWEGLFWATAGDQLTDHRGDLEPFVVSLMEKGSQHSLKKFYSVNQARQEMYQQLVRVFATHDALISPTLAVASVPADHDSADPNFTIDGRPASPYQGWIMTYPYNIVNTVPVASVPSGFSATTGVPIGLQIAGHAFDDVTVFQLAAAYEQAAPWRGRVPDL